MNVAVETSGKTPVALSEIIPLSGRRFAHVMSINDSAAAHAHAHAHGIAVCEREQAAQECGGSYDKPAKAIGNCEEGNPGWWSSAQKGQ